MGLVNALIKWGESMKKIVGCMILMILALTGCSGEETIPTSAEQVLKAVMECPNEKLYHYEPTVIGLDDTEEKQKERAEAAQKTQEQEKEAWEEAVGECFADGMFDTFYQRQERSFFFGAIVDSDIRTKIQKMELTENEDSIQHIMVTMIAEGAEEKEFAIEWRVIYDKDHPERIQSLELVDDDGFWEWSVEGENS